MASIIGAGSVLVRLPGVFSSVVKNFKVSYQMFYRMLEGVFDTNKKN
jgi:hypothetical protein